MHKQENGSMLKETFSWADQTTAAYFGAIYFFFSHINLQFRWICLLLRLHRNKINLEHLGNISYQVKLLLWYLNI